mmetsp:Transcript_35781/g.75171  ORF Transcript_35781/g.75171 Transcript_35781/m.75171 type:complete len:104 (-) Transcript_35781:2-313(-)
MHAARAYVCSTKWRVPFRSNHELRVGDTSSPTHACMPPEGHARAREAEGLCMQQRCSLSRARGVAVLPRAHAHYAHSRTHPAGAGNKRTFSRLLPPSLDSVQP